MPSTRQDERTPEPMPDSAQPSAQEPWDAAGDGGQVEASEHARRDGESELAALERQRDEYQSKWQRAQADYQNLKRRSAADFEAITRRTMQPLLEDLLLVLDHLDLALQSPTEEEQAKSLAAGVQLTRDQFMRALEHAQVKPVAEEGLFDPAIHQAVGTVRVDDVEPGSVVQTVRRGYTWREGVLRHAQVLVAADRASADAEDER